jgi:hypothetical protein
VLGKVARRVNDAAVLWLLKLLLKASGKQGVPQGGVSSPLLSNLYLNEVDQMLERAKEVTRHEQWTAVEYARYADYCAPRAQRVEEGPKCVTVLSMREGPSEPACRSRFQTTSGGCGQSRGRERRRKRPGKNQVRWLARRGLQRNH